MNMHHQKRTVRIALSVCAAAALATSVQAQASSNPGPNTTRAEAAERARLTEDDREFLIRAALLGHEEVRLSQLAATRASNQQVRDFAQKLVDDHQKANKKLMSLAGSKGLMLSALEMAPGASARIGSSPGAATAGAADSATARNNRTGTSATTGSSNMGAGTAAGSTYAAVDPEIHEEVNEQLTEGLEEIREKEANLAEKTGQDFDEAYVETMIKGHEKSIKLFRDVADRDEADSEIASFASETLSKLEQHHRTAEQLEEVVD